MSQHRAAKSGLAADAQNKIKSKYDTALAGESLAWIKSTLIKHGEEADFDTDGSVTNVYNVLKDGVYLGKLMNIFQPGCISAAKLKTPPKMAFKQMELIGLFLEKVQAFGVPSTEAFATVDLFEQQNMHQVVVCLQSLGRKAQAKGFEGFGPKEAEANKRDFTEEQLREGQSIIGLQMGSNKGASQAGQNFGKARMIVD